MKAIKETFHIIGAVMGNSTDGSKQEYPDRDVTVYYCPQCKRQLPKERPLFCTTCQLLLEEPE